jgi:glycine cleavage system aminomethyltransferase T
MVEPGTDSDYVGREALERIARDGVNRKLVGVGIEGDPLEAENTEPWPVVDADGSQIGRVTAAIHSPRLERNIGYAWVPIELAEPGTRIRVDAPKGPTEAVTTSLPFWDPRKETPKA